MITRSVSFCGTVPCIRITCLKDAYLTTNAIFDMLRKNEKPNQRSSEGGARGRVALLEGLRNWVEYLKILSEKNFSS